MSKPRRDDDFDSFDEAEEELTEYRDISELACELRRYEKRGDEAEAQRVRALLDEKLAATPLRMAPPLTA